jgi:hypothetical protein
MTELKPDAMELLNALLDGETTQEQAAQIDMLTRSDPDFRAAVERLRCDEGRLRRLYALTAPAQVLANHPATRAKTPVPRWSSHRVMHRALAYAAMLLIVAAAAFYAAKVPDHARLQASALHEGFVRNEVPTTVCDTPEKFLAYTQEHLGVGIEASFDSGVRWVGWRGAGQGYDHADSRTRLLMAFAPTGEHVVVLFQPRGKQPPQLQGSSTLSIFSKTLGDIEAFEITRLRAPVALSQVRLAR